MNLIGLVDGTVLNLGHRRAKRLESSVFGLIGQGGAIDQKEDALRGAGFPQSPDNLESSEGFSGAGRHGEQDTLLTFGDCLDRAIDGDTLIVAGLMAASLQIIGLGNKRLDIVADALPLSVFLPEFVRGWELIERQLSLDLLIETGAVVEEESVAIGTKDEGNVQRVLAGVVEPLLHSGADGMIIVFGLDDGNREVGPIGQHKVSALALAAPDHITAHNNRPGGKINLFANLILAPAGAFERRHNEF